ncbi:MFS transporter [Haliangium sp. UPWRP_2]|uniref:MFS transporter n=1 Tax=Haliangium sp. UPWRP_2 TaxID=1931276 RepID=UPI000B53CF66|nr:MFS transporter [Haliangium sp. UPWRP_2]PSM31566.1 MFS transporter [Haliangium sp. UPWRP_2]
MTTHALATPQPLLSTPNPTPAPKTSEARSAPTPLWRDLTPLCLMVFTEFLAMGLPLPVLPIRVHEALGFGSFFVGLALGAQSWITLLSRHTAGTRSDQRGPRHAMMWGLALSALAGLISALSTAVLQPSWSLLVLLLGRGLLGLGESLVITSALAWGVTLAGRERSGSVMAWVGIAMYGALAVGAPIGTALDARFGFVGLSLFAAAAPLSGLAGMPLAKAVQPVGGVRLPFYQVSRLIWLPGAGLSLCALGFGAIAAFATLFFHAEGFAHAALAMSAFGAAYVLARLLFAGLPDRFGGAKVAAGSAVVATLGQLGMCLSTTGSMAVAAAALTGLGFSLAFPSFGVEAIRRVPPQNRGVALGAYAACFDATMGLGVPALGMVVAGFGYRAAFALGAIGATVSLLIALGLASRHPQQ